MDIPLLDAALLVVVGFAAGFLNVVAGGGSLISLPILIFLGLPPAVANASNRVAIFSQNIFGILGFKSKGVSAFPYSLWLGISALFGAIIGAKISVNLDADLFNKIIAIIMIMVVVMTIIGPKGNTNEADERTDLKSTIIGIITFFFIGIYGGFIQAGVGFLIMAALTGINKFSLVKTNSAKVFVVFIYTIASLGVFIWEDVIDWEYGIILAVGNSLGAWVASRWSVAKGDKWIKRFLILAVTALAVKLWFF
ncbi:sulfite exporter TauE/SafE family protein [Fulvivirga sp. RKSG066]|uniref:sulfite exporter TauE/SafE family protein n=1 Tax=Fulvivirga aurantia TaxID=2529383 RepID=UPI0012BC056E|nr:sulfite exporter TauE/SafE family protein [Fulvivirga aurantia]MTI21519.1 sulfite exporter TauE/SafE family protein [Fulvivirga aurantia]